MNCPHCGKNIDSVFAKIAAKGGRKKSAAKTAGARKAIKERWRKYRANKKINPPNR